jgi:hypothetical protein
MKFLIKLMKEDFMKNMFAKSVLGASLLVGAVSFAQAALISYGGNAALDGSGVTSVYMDPTQAPGAAGGLGGVINGVATTFFIETFDSATQMAGFGAGSTAFNQTPATGCALNSTGAGIVATGSFGIGNSNVSGGRAAPAGDATCFGYTPALNGPANGQVEINYSSFLNSIGSGLKITYLGFYWGSADRYNTLTFFNGQEQVLSLTGSQLLNANNGQSGNQIAPGSNQYVNILLDNAQAFDRIQLVSTSRAFEVDNIVVGATQVPEPAALGVLGLLLLGMRRLVRAK